MGVFKLFSDDKSKSKIETPNPKSFVLMDIYDGKNPKGDSPIAIKAKYDGCFNYDGIKILVYDNRIEFDLLLRNGSVDPHFLEDSYSPVARFEPTERGWFLACKLVDNIRVKKPRKT